MKIKESEQFKKELRTIALHIKKDKPSAAIKFVTNLKTAINNLVDSPCQYRQSIYLDNSDIRDMTYYGYTVIYEIKKSEDILIVLTIFNRNLPDI